VALALFHHEFDELLHQVALFSAAFVGLLFSLNFPLFSPCWLNQVLFFLLGLYFLVVAHFETAFLVVFVFFIILEGVCKIVDVHQRPVSVYRVDNCFFNQEI
jgi:hypothetical protein